MVWVCGNVACRQVSPCKQLVNAWHYHKQCKRGPCSVAAGHVPEGEPSPAAKMRPTVFKNCLERYCGVILRTCGCNFSRDCVQMYENFSELRLNGCNLCRHASGWLQVSSKRQEFSLVFVLGETCSCLSGRTAAWKPSRSDVRIYV